MEKLHLADLKAKAAKLAKKPKAEDGEAEKEAEAPKSKPIQRPMSKLDREIAAKKAKDEAKEARGPRRRRRRRRHPAAAETRHRTPATGPPLHRRAIAESRSCCLACAEGSRAREEEGGACGQGRHAQKAQVGLPALQRPSL
jgi:hypothetical protein